MVSRTIVRGGLATNVSGGDPPVGIPEKKRINKKGGTVNEGS